MGKWKAKELVPVIPGTWVWGVVPEDNETEVLCIAPTKEAAERIVRERNFNEETFYRLTEEDFQTVAKQRLGRLLTPEELKSACEAGSAMDIPWDEYLDGILECENFDASARCMYCTLHVDKSCPDQQSRNNDCGSCKFCALYPKEEIRK